jgi:hypothetical protein
MEPSIGFLALSKDYGKREAESKLLSAGAAGLAFAW